MYEGSSRTLFSRYAIPQMVGLLFNSVYTIVDGVFIGNRLGQEAMAAAAVAVPLLEVLISLALAVASGAGVLIAAQLGVGTPVKARRIFNTAVWMLGGTGLVIAITGNLLLRPLAELLGSTPDILAPAMTYLRYIVSFAPFQLFSFLLGGMVRNDGRPRLAMTAMILGAITNVFLDYVFMYPLNMGIGGAALATALGPLISVLILLPHFLRQHGHLYFMRCRPIGCDIKNILFNGFPSFIMEFSIGMVTLIYNIAITHYGYGEIGLAAYLVIGYLMLIILTIFLGLAEGLQPVFSYFAGVGAVHRNKALRKLSVKIFLGTGLLCYVMIVLFSAQFFSVFCPGDIELIAFAQKKSLAYFSGFFLAGYNILMISFWQSTGQTQHALSVSLSRSIVWTPLLTVVLPLAFGRESIWICQSAGEVLTAGLVLFFLLRAHKEEQQGR